MKFTMLFKDTVEAKEGLRRYLGSRTYFPDIMLVDTATVEIVRGAKRVTFLEAKCKASVASYLWYRMRYGKHLTIIRGW